MRANEGKRSSSVANRVGVKDFGAIVKLSRCKNFYPRCPNLIPPGPRNLCWTHELEMQEGWPAVEPLPRGKS